MYKLFNISKETRWAILKGDWCFQIGKFSSFGTTFSFFTLFTVYNLNNSYFIYEICSKFQQKHLGCYSKEIGLFKFGNFLLLVTLFKLFLSFSPFII